MRDHKLELELQDAGADAHEAQVLSALAGRLEVLRPALQPRGRFMRPLAAGLASLAATVVILLVSESVMPTSFLYPVQQFSDATAMAIHPQYRATVMMKRAQQINTMVAVHAKQGRVMATLSDYTHQANMYKKQPGADYAAFEFCKTNLQQAATHATPEERSAITNSLQSLRT